MKQMSARGKTPLSEKQLHVLVANNSLHLTAIDFDARVHFQPNGQLHAAALKGGDDKGKWSITSDNKLCLKFDHWYYGDLKCYTLFNEKDQSLFFTANGARYYTGQANAENDMNTGERQTTDAAVSGNNSIQPSARLTSAEKTQTLIGLARNCPDCIFAGADLSGAQLAMANLAGADLSGADLSDANLRRAKLSGANLHGANLSRTNLAGADLSECDLRAADLTGSNLVRADVTGAKLDGANMSGAHLENIIGLKK